VSETDTEKTTGEKTTGEGTETQTKNESVWGTNPHAESVHKLADAMMRFALWPAVVTVVVGAVVSVVLFGLPGLWSALIGGVVAFGSCLATLWMMHRTAALPPMMVMAVALGGYIFKMLVLLGVMTLLGGISGLDRYALAFTMLAVILVWAGAEVLAFRKTKIPTIIPDSSPKA
jgi:ATP synthase protein I